MFPPWPQYHHWRDNILSGHEENYFKGYANRDFLQCISLLGWSAQHGGKEREYNTEDEAELRIALVCANAASFKCQVISVIYLFSVHGRN